MSEKIPVYRGNLPAAMGADFEFIEVVSDFGKAVGTESNFKRYQLPEDIPDWDYNRLRWRALDDAVKHLSDPQRTRSCRSEVALISGVNIISENKYASSDNLEKGYLPAIDIIVEAIAFRRRDVDS